MRYLVIADIHSNLEAFKAVLEDACDKGGFDRTWCLGDVVGYGPDPSACIQLLRELDPVCVCGNHDQAAVGKIDTGNFRSEAARANRWTAGQLGSEELEFLAGLPLSVTMEGFTLVHGSPREPVWEYVFHDFTALDNFDYFDTPYCIVGHTHVPYIYEYDGTDVCDIPLDNGDELELGVYRLIINPGGVGQPRDRNPRASYIIFNSDEMVMHAYRVSYDIAAVQAKILGAGLPDFLASRLEIGE